ncbi:MAG: spermine/spermidine synthase family protein [Verrucomicrobiales bacterium]|nr:spermine/spermidine synthase family protein [Verrucomicrobiales bacterium]
MTSAKAISLLVTGCFFISGIAGLIYQVVWSRYLALFLGHTSYAVVAVLAAFMGGLALGNAWLGAAADRVRRPLAFYGLLEIGIALYAFLFPFYFELCYKAYISVARGMSAGMSSLLILKFGFSLALVLLPTALMGATFPALTRFVTRSLDELRGRVGWLYCVNSLGAVFGCFIADYWWIPQFGLEVSILGSGIMNLLVGLLALGISKSTAEGQHNVPETSSDSGDLETFTPIELRLGMWAIGLSGFVAMLYEVAWTRLLSLALGSSTHAYTLMLITFILGIAAGGGLVAKWRPIKGTLNSLGWAEAALAGSVFFSLFFYQLLPYGLIRVTGHFPRTGDFYPLYELTQALFCLAVMFIPALCLGTTLPLASRIATARLTSTGRSVGKVFAVNTAGTVLGTALTGLLLMPVFGLARTFAFGVVLNALIAVLILCRNANSRRPVFATMAAGILYISLADISFGSRWQKVFSYGWWRSHQIPGSISEFNNLSQTRTLHFHRDGAGSTVDVDSQGTDTNAALSLRVNGKVDATSRGDHPTQLLLGHIPMILHPTYTNALVIGLGSGMTCGAILRHPTIQSVTAVEISPEISRAARLFGEANDHALDNPRLKLMQEDAKSYLKINQDQFNLIVSEPSNPWMAGVAGVFSLEYYQDCATHLTPNGSMVQWLQVYESSDEVFSMVLRTFSTAFPTVSIWITQKGDLALVGSVRSLPVDLGASEQRFHQTEVAQDLQRTEIRNFPVFLSLEVISAENGAALISEDGPVHSDYFPALEYEAQRAFFARGAAQLWLQSREAWTRHSTLLLAQYLEHHRLSEADLSAFALRGAEAGEVDDRLSRSLYLEWLRTGFAPNLALQYAENLPSLPPASLLYEETWQHQPAALLDRATRDVEGLKAWERLQLRAYRQKRSIFHQPDGSNLQKAITRLKEIDAANIRVYKLHEAELAWDQGNAPECFRLGKEALENATGGNLGSRPFEQDVMAPRVVLTLLIEYLFRTQQTATAAAWANAAREQKYLEHDANYYLPLERVCRKVLLALPQNPSR